MGYLSFSWLHFFCSYVESHPAILYVKMKKKAQAIHFQNELKKRQGAPACNRLLSNSDASWHIALENVAALWIHEYWWMFNTLIFRTEYLITVVFVCNLSAHKINTARPLYNFLQPKHSYTKKSSITKLIGFLWILFADCKKERISILLIIIIKEEGLI